MTVVCIMIFIFQVLNCVVDFNRRYIEVDDELVSIITDIEGRNKFRFFFCLLFLQDFFGRYKEIVFRLRCTRVKF